MTGECVKRIECTFLEIFVRYASVECRMKGLGVGINLRTRQLRDLPVAERARRLRPSADSGSQKRCATIFPGA